MKPVERSSVLDYVTYNEKRNEIRARVLEIKKTRRVHVGPVLTFLFETTETLRYQVQEMMRVEQIVKEADIQHEIDTYNEVLGGPGDLGCTLLIEIDDPGERAVKLSAWVDLPRHLYVRVEGGEKVYAKFDPRQVGDTRLSSVQYLQFETKGRKPVAVGSDLPALLVEAELDAAQRAALAEDVSG
jgi:hypothetical protein